MHVRVQNPRELIWIANSVHGKSCLGSVWRSFIKRCAALIVHFFHRAHVPLKFNNSQVVDNKGNIFDGPVTVGTSDSSQWQKHCKTTWKGFYGVGPEVPLSCLQHNRKECVNSARLMAEQVMFPLVGSRLSWQGAHPKHRAAWRLARATLEIILFYIMDRAQYATIWLYNPDERDIMTDWHSKSPVCAGARSHLTSATSELVFHSTAMKLDNRKTSPASWVWRGKESDRNVDFSAAPASHNAGPS